MYIARKIQKDSLTYSLRESYLADGYLQSRSLVQLGSDPGEYIKYPGGHAYYFDEKLVEALHAKGIKDADNRLDDLLWHFLKPEVKRAVGHFSRRQGPRRKAPFKKTAAVYHHFDKRRVLFLKSGRLEQGPLRRLPAKLFQILDHKSRDEIEQYFLFAERILKPAEIKLYTYVIFDLQKQFASPLARRFPAAMGGEKMDAHFIDAICRLADDHAFRRGLPAGRGFNEYLARYVSMYFDNDFPEEDLTAAYVRNFMRDRRRFRFPDRPSPAMSLKAATRALGLSAAELKEMAPATLTRHYRKMAIKLHPDQGGDHDRFIKITEAYQAALHRLKKTS